MIRALAAGLMLAACAAMTGCVTRGPLMEGTAVELPDVPFYPQQAYQCGPAALATVLGASGLTATPEELVPLVYLPTRRGSLQVELMAAPRKYARLSYPLAPELDALLAEIRAGRPVLVLHNYGLPGLPRWHYAVVIGYNPRADTVLLRSGTTRRQVLSARNFMRAWDNGGRWAMVVLRPGELPAEPDRAKFLEAAAAFERVGEPQDSWRFFDATARQWPQEPVAWIGRGTAAYRRGELAAAARDFSAALRLDSAQIGARNNLAMTLLELGCVRRARLEIDQIDVAGTPEALRRAVLDTRKQVQARASLTLDDSASCAIM